MPEQDPRLAKLLDAAYREALAKFHRDVAGGEIDAAGELATFRRRRRDYVTALRLGDVPAEADALAARLLQGQGIALSGDARQTFALETTRLLVRLYDAFIAGGESAQGSR